MFTHVTSMTLIRKFEVLIYIMGLVKMFSISGKLLILNIKINWNFFEHIDTAN